MMDLQTTLGEMVARRPEAARVLHRHRLDFCCGGGQSVAQAAEGIGLDPETLLAEIDREARNPVEGRDWREAPLDELIQHILTRYHQPLPEELARLTELSEKVERVHSDHPSCPAGLTRLLQEITVSVDSHLQKEERILFPAILSGGGRVSRMPIQVLVQEHQDHGVNLDRIRGLTGNLEIPEGACASWKALYLGLTALEIELMAHIHLENNILFPRALRE